jgi:hypothetical protein
VRLPLNTVSKCVQTLLFVLKPSSAVVLADARPAAFLAPASLAVVLAEARPAAFLAHASDAVVLADA